MRYKGGEQVFNHQVEKGDEMLNRNRVQRAERRFPEAERGVVLAPPDTKGTTLTSLQREVAVLKRALAQRDHEVWTLKQLLLYR